jgi:multidrug/hemolysin transport system permease protein
MVQDKVNGTIKDLTISPIKSSSLALSYYIASFISTLIVCLVSLIICLTYLAIVGWYLTFLNVLCLLFDVTLLVLFGTALSSVINFFLSSQGQISAVGTIISAGYGFICGAYMPISSFGGGLQKVISFLPGTYGTSLIRNHSMQGAFNKMHAEGVSLQAIEDIKSSIDCNLYFFGHQVNVLAMYLILGVSVLLLIGAYILINKFKKKRTKP